MKLQSVPNQESTRYHHAYFDYLPGGCWILASFKSDEESGVLTFSLAPQDTATSDRDYQRLCAQWKQLKLQTQYEALSASELPVVLQELRLSQSTELPPLRIRRHLADEANRANAKFGPNHWRTLSYKTWFESPRMHARLEQALAQFQTPPDLLCHVSPA
ncbi:hypothetical protein [Austwickia chelonae]|uniref:hypothetical protein n=1 Tax=Austwickia chelonae TaxID=100225 RepID=UPI0011605D2A|nr:hypothetical protein [Austwickia chelonae]